MINIPTIVEPNAEELIMLIIHVVAAFTLLVHITFVYVQEHTVVSSEHDSYKKHLTCSFKSLRLSHLCLALFTLIHILFLTTYLFGFNVGIMLEINLMIIFITVAFQRKEKKALALLALFVLLYSFVTIKGPFYQFLSQFL